jgi:hypothetical protein
VTVAAPLLLELLSWVASRPRTYGESIDAWGSTCPRHPVWDDALAAGLIRVERQGGPLPESPVTLTASGRAAIAHP